MAKMNDHFYGLGFSPGWTKTQATEPADHKPFNRLNQFRCFSPYISLDRAKSINKKPSNTKSYFFRHRLVNKDLVTTINQMPIKAQTVGHIYHGQNTPSRFSTLRHPLTSSTMPSLPNKNMGKTPFSKKTTEGENE